MPKSSTGPLTLIRAALFLASIWAAEASDPAIRSNGVPISNFELQTNLVSCTAGAAAGAGTGSTSGALAVPVCSQPESKLFGNIKIINGTPQPGPVGVRGRLYDVGKLCDRNITDRVDRAWIAFLDCDGCPLATKLLNLQGSNPQAILIYNQTSCVFPPQSVAATTTPVTPISAATTPVASIPSTATPVTSTPAMTTPVASIPSTATPVASIPATETPATSAPVTTSADATTSTAVTPPVQVSTTPAPVATTTQSQTAVPTNTADPSSGTGQGNSADGDDVGSDSVRHSHRIQAKNAARRAKNSLIKHPSLVRRGDQPGGPNAQLKAPGADPAGATIESATIVAMADQGTVDYLFQLLLGPASLAPMPAALKTLKKIAAQSVAAKDTGNNNSTTDLIISISPAYEVSSSSSSDSSISKAVFAAVVSVLCVVICGLVLMYVVRPFILRRRRCRQQGSADFVGEGGESEKQHINNASSSSSNIKGDIGDSGEGGGSDYYHVGHGNNSYGNVPNYNDRLEKKGELGAVCITTQDNSKDGCDTGSRLVAFSDNTHAGKPGKDHTPGYTNMDMATRDDHSGHKNNDDVRGFVNERLLLRQLRQPGPRPAFPIKGSQSSPRINDPQSQISDGAAFDHPVSAEDSDLHSWVPAHRASSQTEDASISTAPRSRNGSNLFYDTDKDYHPHPSEIDAKTLAMSGGLATSLYKRRLSMEQSSALSSAEDSTGIITEAQFSGSAVAPRTSLSNDHWARRSSMDTYRRNIQFRSGEHLPSAYEPEDSTETAPPRTSFVDGFATSARARHSMDELRPGTKSRAPIDTANASGEQDRPVQSWSRYNTRQGLIPGE